MFIRLATDLALDLCPGRDRSLLRRPIDGLGEEAAYEVAGRGLHQLHEVIGEDVSIAFAKAFDVVIDNACIQNSWKMIRLSRHS